MRRGRGCRLASPSSPREAARRPGVQDDPPDNLNQAQYESIKLGYCAGNRVGLGQDTVHGIDNPSLDECAKYVLSDERCAPGGYFDAVVLNNGLYQCKCPAGTHDCVVASQPLSGDWNIYRATDLPTSSSSPSPSLLSSSSSPRHAITVSCRRPVQKPNMCPCDGR